MSLDTGVLDVVRHLLNGVRRSGPDNVMAICPFHTKDGLPESTPSFAISLVTGMWMCHACHEKGTLRTFLRNVGVPGRTIDTFYKPLLEQVDQQVSIQHKKRSRILNDISENVLEERTLGLFEYCPIGLLEEGFSEETLKHFDVGFDTKHNRITFPIRDLTGRLIGISGRATVFEDQPRYKVYADKEYKDWGLAPVQTDKSRVLWNIERVYPGTYFDQRPAILVVEGFKACMWCYQAGFKNVVALMGSYSSDYQLNVLQRMGGAIYLFFDNDDAGKKATFYTGCKLRLALPVRVVPYLEAVRQPTDLSPEIVQEAVSKAVDHNIWEASRVTE